MEIAIEVLSIITLSIVVLTFGIIITRVINLTNAVTQLEEQIQELTIIKAEEIELRDRVETFSPKNSFGSYGHTEKLVGKD